MRTPLLLVVLLWANLAGAEAERPPRNWTVGAGLGFTWSPALGLSGLAGLAGSSTLGGLSTLQPSVSALIERRLGARTFLLFQLAGGYSSWRSTTDADSSSRQFNLDGQLGVRHVFNPGGVVELSWYGSARAGWQSFDAQLRTQTLDPSTGTLSPDLVTTHARGLSVGAATGLVLERELLEGLALRLSSSVLGFSFGTSSFESVGNFPVQPGGGQSFDIGLRFSPTVELRYAF